MAVIYLGLSVHIYRRFRSSSVIWYRVIATYVQIMRGKLLSNCVAAGVNRQSISRTTFQFVDLYQLVNESFNVNTQSKPQYIFHID